MWPTPCILSLVEQHQIRIATRYCMLHEQENILKVARPGVPGGGGSPCNKILLNFFQQLRENATPQCHFSHLLSVRDAASLGVHINVSAENDWHRVYEGFADHQLRPEGRALRREIFVRPGKLCNWSKVRVMSGAQIYYTRTAVRAVQ